MEQLKEKQEGREPISNIIDLMLIAWRFNCSPSIFG